MKIKTPTGEEIDLDQLPKEEVIKHYAALQARYKIACQETDNQKRQQAYASRQKDEMREGVIRLVGRLTSDYSRDDFAALLVDTALGDE